MKFGNLSLALITLLFFAAPKVGAESCGSPCEDTGAPQVNGGDYCWCLTDDTYYPATARLIARLDESACATEIDIPAVITLDSVEYPVTEIYIDAFRSGGDSCGVRLTNVTLPDSLEVIQAGAFGDNQLTRIALPKALKDIGFRAFRGNQIQDVVIPASTTSISGESFALNPLENIIFLGDYGLVFDTMHDRTSEEVFIAALCGAGCAGGWQGKNINGVPVLVPYADGSAAGYTRGYGEGEAAGDAAGYTRGYGEGEAAGDAAGYTRGYGEGEVAGDAAGYTRGYGEGEAVGYTAGFTVGYAEGETSGEQGCISDPKSCGLEGGKFSEGYQKCLADCSSDPESCDIEPEIYSSILPIPLDNCP